MPSSAWKSWSLPLVCLAFAAAAPAQPPSEEPAPLEGYRWETEGLTQQDVEIAVAAAGTSLSALRRQGLLVFTTPFTAADGFGDGPFDPSETPPLAPGNRPTLGGNGTVLRVNGLDAQSCNECHTLVSNATRPPTLGFAGVGGLVQNAVIGPSLIDVADSFDDRVQHEPGHEPDMPMHSDGAADFNGRLANPPFLFGGGGVELLAKEMTEDLQALLAAARGAPAGTVTSLDTHGVHFGTISTVDDAGNVELHPEGIGPIAYQDLPPEQVLVVRPFGRKGENFSMRDFDRGAMQFHFGIQPVEVVGEGVDGDGDGVSDEVTVAEMTVLHIFDVSNPPPRIERLGRAELAGLRTFRRIGCADCHRERLETRSRLLPLAHPEVAERPRDHAYARIDLARVGFARARGGDGVVVPLFADLKRHQMGPRLAETFERATIANDEFTTARLWGVADTAPYLHDGRATTLFAAIEFHGGEAQPARDAFLALSETERRELLAFLGRLRTPVRPNEDLLH
jgi:Di-haem oxidoreductase, putative peroxidase